MDSLQIRQIIDSIQILKYKFMGTYPADMVPRHIPEGKFCIVNSDVQDGAGSHWVMLAAKNSTILFADSLARKLHSYKNIDFKNLRNYPVVNIVVSPLQREELCALYCVYFAYVIFSRIKDTHVDDYLLMRFFARFL